MLRLLTCLLPLLMALPASAQSDPAAFRLFTPTGKKTKYKKLLRDARAADVILFGEQHNNPIAHWLQHRLARDLATTNGLTLGLEMLETDQQTALNAYLAGEAKVEAIDDAGEGLWSNWRTDYAPLVGWAKNQGHPVVATNVPRPYARKVFSDGFEVLADLPIEEKALLPPYPVPYDAQLPGYVRMLEMMPGGHGGENFPKAQAIKDATMAYFIAQNHRAGVPFLHLNGSYHSDDYEGIGWYLKQYAPQLKVLTLSTGEQDDLASLGEELKGKADYIIVTPTLMTKTY